MTDKNFQICNSTVDFLVFTKQKSEDAELVMDSVTEKFSATATDGKR